MSWYASRDDLPKSPAHAFQVMNEQLPASFWRRSWIPPQTEIYLVGRDGVGTTWYMAPGWVRDFCHVAQAYGLRYTVK